MWQVMPGLYLGDREDARDRPLLEDSGITHVVNCAAELPSHLDETFAHLRLNLDDPDPGFRSRIPMACSFIDEGRQNGGVLVHCTAAVSRGPAVVLAYLCHCGDSLEHAAERLSQVVLSGIDAIFLRELAAHHGRQLSAEDLKTLALILLGRTRRRRQGSGS